MSHDVLLAGSLKYVTATGQPVTGRVPLSEFPYPNTT